MRGEVKRKGFWHEPDATPTSKTIALQTWTPLAAELLAARDGRRMLAADLAAEVQARSGVHTSHPPATWVPDLLVLVDHLRRREGEEPLGSLVSTQPERSSAARRSPGRTASPRAPRAPAAPRRVARTDVPVATCPRCFMALPATGICDNCD